MRAREFITEEKILPNEQGDPLAYVYRINGLFSSDTYQTYRVGVAMARARSNAVKDDVNPYMLPWDKQEVFGEHGVIAGVGEDISNIIDQALQMTDTPGGKQLVGSADSNEPSFVDTQSPVKGFKGYPR
jgi:hypothetical protein